MWVSDKWEDYVLLDTADGERLERWGNFTLIRPDPQVIWPGRRRKDWQADAVYHRSKNGGGSWEIRNLPETWMIRYRDLAFHLKAFSFKHTGIFPEQAVNWDFAADKIRRAKAADPDRDIRILNLFAYTGAASVSAAAAGAFVTHVDASRGMVNWAHENADENGITSGIRWLVDDCIKFVQREIRRGNTYDGIILDPPSYGRGPKGEIWKIEEMLASMLGDIVKILSPDPLFIILNSYTTGLPAGVLTYLLSEVLQGKGARILSDELGLPVESSGLILPCGCCARAVFGEDQ